MPKTAGVPTCRVPEWSQTVDLVEDRRDLGAVVLLGQRVVGRPVVAARVGDAVDLGGEQVLDAGAGRAVEDLVGRVLVRPGRAQPVRPGHLEHRVHAEVLVRVDRQCRWPGRPAARPGPAATAASASSSGWPW